MRSISVGLDREESGSDGLCLGLIVLATLAAGFVAGSDVLRCRGFGPATGDVCLWVGAGFWGCSLPGGWTRAWLLGCGSEGSSDVLQELCGTPDDWMEKMMAEALRERRRMRAFVMVDL
ncbi:hypothetical protein J0A71_11g24460 [Encephalitozoon cuniculi]|nr:hypothetical protein J0A71_01g00100 [Encephalitozoon cuniculi]UYI26431.1 hypothetical protein J0A71_01g02510 [Encephalitozoon cuniculi]UYI26450.1 hypothetical protein J0A71_02g02750 [Encephalitozoon cuniculi]UYI26657.1 hypothetical protein J0A71_02g04880 [Encephalitozoon cuniculi]UYI26903.1 hypothetical protein J0A71_03g07430 [Encephalitozoon cuniculi]